MMYCLTLCDKYLWSKYPPEKKYFWALLAEKSDPGEFLSYIHIYIIHQAQGGTNHQNMGTNPNFEM